MRSRRSDRIVATLGLIHNEFLVHASGPRRLLLSCLLYEPAATRYARALRERGPRVFTPPELALFGVIVAGALLALQMLATGSIEL